MWNAFRRRKPKVATVQCYWCHNIDEVHENSKAAFVCRSCGQMNGCTKDGDRLPPSAIGFAPTPFRQASAFAQVSCHKRDARRFGVEQMPDLHGITSAHLCNTCQARLEAATPALTSAQQRAQVEYEAQLCNECQEATRDVIRRKNEALQLPGRHTKVSWASYGSKLDKLSSCCVGFSFLANCVNQFDVCPALRTFFWTLGTVLACEAFVFATMALFIPTSMSKKGSVVIEALSAFVMLWVTETSIDSTWMFALFPLLWVVNSSLLPTLYRLLLVLMFTNKEQDSSRCENPLGQMVEEEEDYEVLKNKSDNKSLLFPSKPPTTPNSSEVNYNGPPVRVSKVQSMIQFLNLDDPPEPKKPIWPVAGNKVPKLPRLSVHRPGSPIPSPQLAWDDLQKNPEKLFS